MTVRHIQTRLHLNEMQHFDTDNNGTTHLWPHYARHVSFVINLHMADCHDVHEKLARDRCAFVRDTVGCHEGENYFSYINFLYCASDNESPVVGGLIAATLCLWTITLFMILGKTADQFFCPALATIAKFLKMSESLAGVTLLAFGNGSPDIFTAIANPLGDTEMMFNELFGASAFVVGVISATIICIKPFTTVGSSYIRDILFFAFACVWISFAIHDEHYTIVEAIATICIYVFYLVVVILDHIILSRAAADEHRRGVRTRVSDIYDMEGGPLHILSRISDHSSVSIGRADVEALRRASFVGTNRNYFIFQQLAHSLNPIDRNEWRELSVFGKIVAILTFPIGLMLLLIIPIVDQSHENHGWSKLLNIIHCFTLPLFALAIATGHIGTVVLTIPVWGYALMTGTILGTILFFTSRTDRPPSYHMLFAVGSFIGSIFIIYVVASEVVAVLGTLGVALQLSKSFLGVTALSWGNSVGDLMANIALAKQGYQKMAFAACFGGPMFNTLLGMGTTFILKNMKSTEEFIYARPGAMGMNCSIFLFIILTFPMVAMLLTNFQARRSVGVYMLSLYAFFMIFTVLCEFEIIHPYGTDHRED